jgi:hypothetical protein
MKITRYLLLLPLLAFTTDIWQPFAVDNRVTVQLPGQPTLVDVAKLTGKPVGHLQFWVLRAPEGIYQIMRIPSGTSISRTDTVNRRSFYQGLLSSLLSDEQGQLLGSVPFTTTAGSGMEYKYRGLHQGTGKRVVKHVRSLVADSIGYTLMFTPTDPKDSLGLMSAEQRRRFYNSLTTKF